jgi:quercetin dioxygenase-like cupin family protein
MQRCLFLLIFTVVITAQTEVEITAEPHHHLTFANDQVRVFYVEVGPGAATLLHWHHHDYIYVTLGDTELTNEVEGKPPVDLKLQDGETRFTPAPFAHLVRIAPGKPFRNVTVELLQDEKLRQSSAHWDPAHPDEDRGLNILHGGTEEILFVKDGVRATEFELQPGGVVPMHRQATPYLLVAVSDLDLREHFLTDVHGPDLGHFKSGESKWLPGGYSHTIKNAATQPAKFVTLEFR